MTYAAALGDLNTDNFGYDIIAWSLFLLCSIFNLIVMLNLLIAIISDTYTRVNATKEKVALKQRADMILDLRRFPCLRGMMMSKSRGACDALFIAINEKQKDKDLDIDVYDLTDSLNEAKFIQDESRSCLLDIDEKLDAQGNAFAVLEAQAEEIKTSTYD